MKIDLAIKILLFTLILIKWLMINETTEIDIILLTLILSPFSDSVYFVWSHANVNIYILIYTKHTL